jgi:lipopolysaccharide transport system permease protein
MHSLAVSNLADASRAAVADLRDGFGRYRTALLFGTQDIMQRYRRSRVGAFWLTINQGVLIAALGTIFGALFGAPMHLFLPHIACGLIFWSFISTAIQDGCKCFISAQNMILQVRMPLFMHVMRLMWRETIILAHNFVIIPIVLVLFMRNPGLPVLLFPLGLLLVVANLTWIVLVLATICTRYRDLPQVIQNVLQVAFYATPIMWTEDRLPPALQVVLLDFNPLYYMLTVMRAPLLGVVPPVEHYLLVTTLAVIGWLVAIFFYGRYRWRVAYWL